MPYSAGQQDENNRPLRGLPVVLVADLAPHLKGRRAERSLSAETRPKKLYGEFDEVMEGFR